VSINRTALVYTLGGIAALEISNVGLHCVGMVATTANDQLSERGWSMTLPIDRQADLPQLLYVSHHPVDYYPGRAGESAPPARELIGPKPYRRTLRSP